MNNLITNAIYDDAHVLLKSTFTKEKCVKYYGLLLFCMALHKSNRTELTEWQNVRRDLIKRFIFFTTWKFLDCLMSACLVSGVSKSGLMHVKYTADKILSDSPISWSDLVVKVNVIWPDFVIFFQWSDLFVCNEFWNIFYSTEIRWNHLDSLITF